MKKSVPVSSKGQVNRDWLWLLVSVLAFVLGLTAFFGAFKILTAVACVGMVILILSSQISMLKRLPVILVMAFLLFSGLTGFWAMSGKFFLREFSKLVMAGAFFLLIATRPRFGKTAMRRVMLVLAGMCALFGLLNVEAATTGLTRLCLGDIMDANGLDMGFEAGTRLTGIMGNANVMASVLALGIFFSLALLCVAESKAEKGLYGALLAINAFAFLLGFSMGGIACFVLAVLISLAFAGKKRGALLLHMLAGAIPSMIWGFASFPFFNQEGVLGMLPLLLLAANVVTVILLELKLVDRLDGMFEKRQKLVLLLLVVLVALGGGYAVAGMSVTGSYTFHTDGLRRAAYPASGAHTLTVQANDEIHVTIISQDMAQVMMHTNTVLYEGPADGADFDVPENSSVCYFTFSAPAGTTLEEAALEDGSKLPLDYKLFPGFVENRLQGLKANQNAIQRTVFFEDGLKLFQLHPIAGSGVGCFETGVTSVQPFYYETRYVHNHYIQTLAESGVIGLILFAGSLLSLAWVLLRHHREKGGQALSWSYPALWGALVMTAAHAMAEVSMSNVVFLCLAFSAFGMISAGFGEKPGAVVQTTADDEEEEEEDTAPSWFRYGLKGVFCVLPVAFIIALGLNKVAQSMVSSPVSSMDGFMDNLTIAATIDPFERNDAKFSYILNAVNDGSPQYRMQADKYAAQLMKVQSNAIPVGLVQYYLATGQYVQAVDAAKAAAVYSASDAKTWNAVILNLRVSLLDTSQGSPLDGPEGPEILAALREYHDMLVTRNEASMEEVALNDSSLDFFERVLNWE